MIELIDVQSAIINRIYTAVPDVEVNCSDIEENFNRPCFYIEISNMNSENLMDKFNERKIEFEILYFPSDPKRNAEDLLKTRDIFNKIFIENPYIEVENDLIVEVENIKVFEIDKVLHCKFSLYICEEYEKTYEYTMNELVLK